MSTSPEQRLPQAPARDRGRHAPTILDVAALSGVSKSTVSNVLRDRPNVSPATRERVRQAMQALGYRPNIVARRLVQQRSSTIGVVVGDLANTFYSELVKLMEHHASAAGLTTMICNTGGRPSAEAARIEALLEERVSGIAMLEFSGDRDTLAKLLAEQVPVVMVSCWEDLADSVAVDDRLGESLAVDHLATLGHRRIGFVSGSAMEQKTHRARRDGYERALLRHGLHVDDRLRVAWDEETADGDARARAELAALFDGDGAPTAFVATTDFVAIRLMEALEALGHGVPEDVSVVGFDGVALGGLSRIGLTTVAQPTGELASIGTEMLMSRIDRGPQPAPSQRRLEPHLVVRRSTAPAKVA
jgi:LacI family transcriptional regulator